MFVKWYDSDLVIWLYAEDPGYCQWGTSYKPKDVVNMVGEITTTKRAMSINKIKHSTAMPGSKLVMFPVYF